MTSIPPFARERRERILDQVRQQGTVRVAQVAATLGVSEVTVRRDITALADQGLIVRVHGGAMLRGPADRTLPDPGVRGVRPGRARYAIGMVAPSMDYYWPAIVRGVQATATRHGSRLVLRGSSYSTTDDRTQIARLVAAGEVNGLLLAPLTHLEAGAEIIRWIEDLGLPVVLIERTVPTHLFTTRFEWVTTDQAHGASLGVRQLASQGHRRIGLLVSAGSPHAAPLREGWAAACADLGLSIDLVPCGEAPGFATPDRERRCDAIIDQCRRSGTTALLVHADTEAIALLQHAQDAGVRVPQDLAIVAYDDEVAGLSDPPLTAVRPPKFQLGAQAAELLLARLDDPGRALRRVTLCPELIVRASCGPHHPH